MKFIQTAVLLVVSSFPALSLGNTIVLPVANELSNEQTHVLDSQIEQAKNSCQTGVGDLFAEVNLVVKQIFPTSGIAPTGIVASFLLNRGLTLVNVREGQVEVRLESARVNATENSTSQGRMIEVSISCKRNL